MKLGRATIFRIPKLIGEGMTQGDIARMFGVHVQTIVYWVARLRKAGKVVPSKMGKRARRI